MPSKLTKDSVIKEAKKIVKERGFDFTVEDAWHDVETSGTRKWVLKIKCFNEGHITEVTLTNWRKKTNKGKCKKCHGRSLTDIERVEKLLEQHGGKYSYEKFKYNGSKELITVTCPDHGDFEIEYTGPMLGNGCQICAGNIPKTGQEIMDILNVTPFYEIIDLEPDQIYTNKTYVKLKCLLFDYHPIQKRPLGKLLDKNRDVNCRACSRNCSSYTKQTYMFLYVRGIDFIAERHVKFEDGSDGYFDIFINANEPLVLEVDGQFHSEDREIFNMTLKERKVLDKKKDDYCKKNNIRVERIHFEELEQRLNEIFPNHKIIKEITPVNIDDFIEKYPEHLGAKIHKLNIKGVPTRKIAKDLNILETRVSKILHGHRYPSLFKHLYPNGINPHVKKGSKHFKFNTKEIKFIKKELESGTSQAETMRRFTRKYNKTLGRGWISKFAGRNNLRTPRNS